MSGVVKGIKKAVKSVGRFVKKNWKKIVIAAAIVFTCGIAAVGMAGFSAAATAAGGGFAGTMSAVGSTMTAGVAAIGGSVGIGSGVTASTAGGAFAAAPAVQGALAASGGAAGATLGTGAAAQALGMAPNAAAFAAGAPAGGVGPNAALAGGAGASGAGSGVVAGGAKLAGGAATNSVMPSMASTVTPGSTAGGGGIMGFMNSPFGQIATQAGVGLVNGYMQGRALDQQLEAQEPNQLWGVSLKKKAGASLTPEEMGSGPDRQWSADSWVRRPGGLMGATPSAMPQGARQGAATAAGNRNTGNRALDYDRRFNPNANNPLSEDSDPTAQYIEGLA